MDDILLTIIISTYKRSNNLERAIKSVLNQKGSYELIVVDDNNSDSEYRKINEELIKKFSNRNFLYLKHEVNKNGAAARNTGIRHAKGKYITFLDDDDEFSESRIAEIEKILKDKSIDFLCSGYIVKKDGFIEKKVIPNLNYSNEKLQYKLLCQESFFGTGSNIICRTEIVNKIQGFDERFIRHQDMEFVIRVLEECKSKEVIRKFSIIKNCDDQSNIPSFEKSYKVKELYLEKFNDLMLKKFSTKENINIKNINYYELLKNAYLKDDDLEKKKARKFLKEKKVYRLYKELYILLRLKIRNIIFIRRIRAILTKLK